MTTHRIVIPYTPRPLFKPYHARTQRWSCLVVHRRGGKSVATVNDMIREAVRCQKVDGRFAYIAPQLNQAKDVIWTYLKRFAGPLITDKNEADLWVEVPNAAGSVSRLRVYGADNADRLRGGYLDFALLDEFADMAPSVFGMIVRPMLADREGGATFIGTIKGRNHLWEMHEERRDDPEWFTMYARASETGIIPPSELREMQKVMTTEEYAQEMELDADAAIRGAYWGKELADAEAAGRMCLVEADPDLPVHTAWDLGVGPNMAVWWWQAVGNEIRVLDFYENQTVDVGFPHYAAVQASKPWKRGDDWVPHDAKVRELGTGLTRIESMINVGFKPKLVPDHKKDDGINAVRSLLPRVWFNMPTLRGAVEGLKQYRTDYDEKLRVFKDTPRPDWTNHRADAFRYLCMAWRELVPKPTPVPSPILSIGALNEVTFDNAFDKPGPRARQRV